MRLNILFVLTIVFKIFCGITAFFMVGYWIYKFHQNEDVSLIESISYEPNSDIMYPEMSVCITIPFIHENLSLDKNYTILPDEYVLYLKGSTSFREEYRNINFNNVTLDLLEYVENIVLIMNNEVFQKNITCDGSKVCQKVNFKNSFNGFMNGLISRCFSFEVNLTESGNVQALYLKFKPGLTSVLDKIVSTDLGQIYAMFNYPGQLLRYTGAGTPIWNNPKTSLGILSLRISTTEILRRRNKDGDPCFADGIHFDEMVLQKHHNAIGCSPPYQLSNKSTCSSEEELIAAIYEWNEIGNRYYPAPCEGMSNIIFTAEKIDYASFSHSLQLVITYPKITRLIKQLRSVDLHALIGNIGGYIGLFLGKYY